MLARRSKAVQCLVGRFQSKDSGKYPCGVFRKGVASNSILCLEDVSDVFKYEVVASWGS